MNLNALIAGRRGDSCFETAAEYARSKMDLLESVLPLVNKL